MHAHTGKTQAVHYVVSQLPQARPCDLHVSRTELQQCIVSQLHAVEQIDDIRSIHVKEKPRKER